MKKMITKLKDTTGNYHGFIYAILLKNGEFRLNKRGMPLLFFCKKEATEWVNIGEKIVKVYFNAELEIW